MSKVWLITGCSRGLGRELAQAVLGAGHRLVATAREPGDLGFLPPNERLRTLGLDVTDAAAARAAVAAVVSAFGRLDVVVNNAGYIKANSLEDLPEEEFRRQIEVNLFGVYNVTRAALPVMHAQRDGHIIQISSIGGRRGTPGLGGYQSAKWAVGGLSEVLAREVAPLGIRVTCVEPGGMRTEMFGLSMLPERLAPDYEPTVGAVIRATFGRPEGARSDPAKVAQAILRLAEEKQPPLHLLLGSDAVSAAASALTARAEEDARWKTLSLSTESNGPGDALLSDREEPNSPRMTDDDNATHIRQVATVFVPVADQDRALDFYLDKLGFEKRADFPYGNGSRWIEVAPPGSANTISLVPPSEGRSAGGNETHCAFMTDDIEADHSALRARGVDVDAEIARKGKRRAGLVSIEATIGDPVPSQFFFRDPDKNRFLIVQPG